MEPRLSVERSDHKSEARFSGIREIRRRNVGTLKPVSMVLNMGCR
jgi:hypothetical protein